MLTSAATCPILLTFEIMTVQLTGSLEHSPSDSFRRKAMTTECSRAAPVCDLQLKEDLAEAMKEDHGEFSSPIVYIHNTYYIIYCRVSRNIKRRNFKG